MFICFFLVLVSHKCFLACGELRENIPYNESNSSFENEYQYLRLLSIHPQNIAANLDLGLLYVELEEHTLAQKYLKQAIVHGNWSNVTALTNYALQLTFLDQTSSAITVLHLALQLFHPDDPNILFMLGLIHLREGNLTGCHTFYREVLAIKPLPEFYLFIISSFNDNNVFSEANEYIAQAVRDYPDHSRLLFVCGVNFHFQSRYDLALEFYQMSGNLNPSFDVVYTNIASVYQMLGKLQQAKLFYEHVYARMQHDGGYLNNFGSLLLAMNEYDEGERLLLRSIAILPDQEHAPVNLAGYYQDEGLLEEAAVLLRHAAKRSDNARQLELRMATLLRPVMKSWSEVLQDRRRLEQQITLLNSQPAPSKRYLQPLMSGLDRIHFYIQYHGLNDRNIQEAIAEQYRQIIRNIGIISPYLFSRDDRDNRSRQIETHVHHDNVIPTIRIGFMSKLFGVFEPHGLLLDGIIKYLPRPRFRVFALEVAPGGAQKLVSPLIRDSADELIQISLDHVHASQTLSALQLDILVFADVLSEPMNHFLLHSRFAHIQIAFWGNPITSGSHHVDYFMSADFMEHPFRTRIPDEQEPYSEQVVLTPGQGVWYYHPQSAEMKQCDESVAEYYRDNKQSNISLTRADFGLMPEWFIFLCPQSVFKLHPLFDQVVAAILRASPSAHIVFTKGRRPRWTQSFVKRLQQALAPQDVQRCHLIERVSSENFLEFIQIADVMLHPFPFDGSRTSADSIAVNIPYVTLPTEYLRGRMGASFLRTMNIPDLVARNVTHYVDIAVRLSVDTIFFMEMKNELMERSWLVWEDMEVPFSWTQFLSVAFGAKYAHSYEQFVRESCLDRNVSHEVYAKSLRDRNHQLFDLRWGRPWWLLDSRGAAVLEDDVTDAATQTAVTAANLEKDEEPQLPRVFRNWI